MSTPVQPRCHLHLPITDSSGVVFPYASITLSNAVTGGAIATDAFVQAEGGNPVSFPLFSAPAIVDIWTDEPVRVRVVAEVSDNVRVILDGIDIMPPAANIVRSPGRMAISGAENIETTAVLMSGAPNEGVFRVADPIGTHEHEGDSKGSVVLTGEQPTDYGPNQSWIGHQAGRNTGSPSSGSSALGANTLLHGASSTVLGISEVAAQPSTGLSGDMATVLSSEDGDATAGSTVVGPGNQTAQGKDMVVLGGPTLPANGTVAPNGSVIVGPGNVIGAATAVKIGADHPASDAGPSHLAIGRGNSAQTIDLPWNGEQTPISIGRDISLDGDPSDQESADDWFGGVSPLAMGTNSTAFSPSLTLLQGDAVTQVAMRAVGDVVVNGQRTWDNQTTTLGFFGDTGIVRPQIPYDSTTVNNNLFNSLLKILSDMGLVYTNDVAQVTESGDHPDGSLLEFAETGQALQWKLPPTSPDYRADNPFTIASGKVVLNAANAPFPPNGVPAIYSAGRADASASARFTYGGVTADDNATGLMLRCLHEKSLLGGETIATTKGYLVGKTAVYAMSGDTISSTVATHSTPVTSGQLLRADCDGTSVVVLADDVQISAFTDATWTTRVKFGYRLTPTTNVSDFAVLPFGF